MAGESGGELDASMLGVGMLDAAPGTFALEVGASNVATADGAAILEFIASSDAAGAGSINLNVLLAFIAQADAGGTGTESLNAMLEFNVSQIDSGAVGSMSLDAWLQMLHAQGDLASVLAQIAGEDRSIRIYNEARTVKPAADGADVIANDNRAVTI